MIMLMTSEALSGGQFHQLPMFVTPGEVSKMSSGDHGYKPMHEVYKSDMVERPRANYDDEGVRHAELHPYIKALNASADQHGGFEVPIRVHHFTNGITKQPDQVLVNGHHRALAANQSNRLLPVVHSDYESGGTTMGSMQEGQKDEIVREDRVEAERGRR